MNLKNIGVITSIKQSLDSKGDTTKKEITIRLDNYLDEKKYNVIYFCDQKIGTVTDRLLWGTQLLVKDDFLFDIKSFDVQTNKKYEFEFEILKNSTKRNISIKVTDLEDLKDISSDYTLKIVSITEKAL